MELRKRLKRYNLAILTVAFLSGESLASGMCTCEKGLQRFAPVAGKWKQCREGRQRKGKGVGV